MKTAIQAGLVALGALAAGATVLVAPAQAATIQRSAVCRAGEFSGRLTLSYENVGFDFRIVGGYTTSGPYIGDVAGKVSLRISYRAGSTNHTVFSQTSATTGNTVFTIPTTTSVPTTAAGSAAATFDNGTNSCTATVPIS